MPHIPEQHDANSQGNGFAEPLNYGNAPSAVTYAGYDTWINRQAQQEQHVVAAAMVDFSAVMERVSSVHASEDDKSDWYEVLDSQSEKLLGLFGDREPQNAAEITTRDLAAVTYTYLRLEHDPETFDIDILNQAGVDVESLATWFKTSISKVYAVSGSKQAEFEQACLEFSGAELEDYGKFLGQDCWSQVVIPRVHKSRAELIVAGYELPRLIEDGKYGDDDLLPSWTLPCASVSRVYSSNKHPVVPSRRTKIKILSLLENSESTT